MCACLSWVSRRNECFGFIRTSSSGSIHDYARYHFRKAQSSQIYVDRDRDKSIHVSMRMRLRFEFSCVQIFEFIPNALWAGGGGGGVVLPFLLIYSVCRVFVSALPFFFKTFSIFSLSRLPYLIINRKIGFLALFFVSVFGSRGMQPRNVIQEILHRFISTSFFFTKDNNLGTVTVSNSMF